MLSTVVAIIPARGGSKRIKEKNIKSFKGKPMIAWTIEAAHKAGIRDVFVSTDSIRIKQISEEYGAKVPFLREKYADDKSPVSLATLSCLEEIEKREHKSFKTVVQLMANCPLRTSKDIECALENFEKENIEFQISCFRYGFANPWWAHIMNENKVPKRIHSNNTNTRSQDLPVCFCPTGAIWISEIEKFKEHKTFYGPQYQFHELSMIHSIDIDDEDDWMLAELCAQSVLTNI